MKHIALILSTYILSLAFSPVISMALQSGGCGKSCTTESMPDKDSDGCPKDACAPFSCCLKNLFPPQFSIKYSALPDIPSEVKNNFGQQNGLASLRSFDIWHPPRII